MTLDIYNDMPDDENFITGDCAAETRKKFTLNPRNPFKYTRARNPKETCTIVVENTRII
jgi:hypothetical protein